MSRLMLSLPALALVAGVWWAVLHLVQLLVAS